ncbi:P-loop containing nucleoside triphosphate hydrolase protein [Annulohypoxylon truncatum]|uniref:P-loop containing nucleoside triphosphate hydrolase protein n=1 Tax=Annulohypoxylon truncatum TaxID=327061 RepID=UPI002008431B|nr:P-loop containing nucleoside triphosphate hydrolase protein [Annulohypoxylon truncatum]KAI1209772.1 P-loop containing nucleoside triphosphate hydrolase protein [Annulohypoxylon truncatum]
MDDTSSTASFEEISPSNKPFGQGSGFNDEDKNIQKLRALVEKSAIDDSAASELAEDEVPDVCYVLQYKGWGGKVIDVRRSHEPINVQLDDMNEEVPSLKKKPVLEIVTKVSTTVIQNIRPAGRRLPPPHHVRWNHRYDYNEYDDFSRPGGPMPRGIDESGVKIAKVETTCMVINSIHLINALKAVVGYYPSVSFLGETVTINAPYYVLVHHREALARHKVKQRKVHGEEYASTTAKHIDILLNFLEKTLGDRIREEEKRHNCDIPLATFDNLGFIFEPGEVIYAKKDYKWTPFVLASFGEGYTNSQGATTPHHIVCWNISYSAERLCRTMHSFSLDPFTGEEAISNLSVIPARFFRGENGDMDPMEVEEKQIELGKMVWKLSQGPSYMSHDGSLAERDPEFNWSYPVSASGYMSGRVIVDLAGFSRYSLDCPGGNRQRARSPPPSNRPPIVKDNLPYLAPCCGCSTCSKANRGKFCSHFAEFEDLDPTSHAAPTEDLYYIVLNKVVSGFILGERRWGHFNVEHLQEVQFDKDAFKYLVLDSEIKLTVRSLIGKFASANGQVTPWPNDFVQNKGQGRIFLLHGSPGVGKTCTAECVAELTHRPLLALTSGDLSTNSYQVEKNLEYFLQLGERFGAMVLLDEADVYLEARRAKDIARNGLVSIFLRALEYYRGVLFLTTNRVQTFDSAFTSRIHVALHYRSLTDADREKIWVNSFERLERDSAGKVHVGVATREYAYESRDVRSLRWNGREIRNALQTAVALAETEALEDGNEKVTVTDKHLRAVVKMSRGFKNFLRSQRLKGDAEVEDDDDENEEEIDVGSSSDVYD